MFNITMNADYFYSLVNIPIQYESHSLARKIDLL